MRCLSKGDVLKACLKAWRGAQASRHGALAQAIPDRLIGACNGAVVSSTFTGNTAGGRGGAIYMSSASDHQSSVANSIFAGNAAASVITGHDMFLAGQDLDFAGGVILGTQARTASGAFAAPADKVTVLDDEGLQRIQQMAEEHPGALIVLDSYDSLDDYAMAKQRIFDGCPFLWAGFQLLLRQQAPVQQL